MKDWLPIAQGILAWGPGTEIILVECPPCLRIGNMNALLFALALEMGLLQMRILDYILNYIAFTEGSMELRGSHLTASHQTDKLKLHKLRKDREMVKDVLRRSLVELATSGEWRCLHQAVVGLDQRACAALARRCHHDLLLNSYEKIANELKSKRLKWTLELRNSDRKVAFLRDKMKDDLLNANTRLCFAEKWLCARVESLDFRGERSRRARDPPAPAPAHEQRVHDELIKTFEIQTKEHEAATERWQVRYGEDAGRMDRRLVDQRQQLEVVVARHDELQKLYDLHEGEMRAWLSFKRQRAERLAREERARTAATRIQAWWRGVMVRKAFGPFRFLRNIKKSSTKNKKK